MVRCGTAFNNTFSSKGKEIIENHAQMQEFNDKMMSARYIQDRVLSNLTTDDRHLIVNDGCIPV